MSIDLDTEMQFLFVKIKQELGCDSDEAALKISKNPSISEHSEIAKSVKTSKTRRKHMGA